MRCGNCNEENPAGTRFCGYCGTPFRVSPAETAEHRHLTVLFCDLVGSTRLSESLDPEDLRELTGTYHTVCEAAIRRHDGHIAQYLGDGVLVYFGYPIAHEDDARRAVRAALEIVDDLARVTALLKSQRGIALSVRMGIHTGPVVVGDVGGGVRREQLALGMTPNLAARIQNIAAPGTVLVSEDTHRLVRGFFDFQPLGAHEIKGLAKEVILYCALRDSGAQSRLDVQRSTGLTPLMGRDRELSFLDERWNDVLNSNSHAVLVQGEAGIGKSRIVDSFRKRVEHQTATQLECFCTPYAQSTPLFPIVAMLERQLGFTRESSVDDKRAAIGRRLARRGVWSDEADALIADLLSVPHTGDDPLANYSPLKRRERTLQMLLTWLLAIAHDGPTLWLIEDVHWIDPTTLEFLSSMLQSLPEDPLLVIMTSRPDFAAPWHMNGKASSMQLGRLGPGETTQMANSVAHGKSMPAELLSQIVARTDGVPLFVEEITKAVLELGVLVEREDRFELSGPLPADLIPSTVQGSLNARLDRLGPAKAIAQIAATIGREFSFALLTSVAGETESELRNGLDRLTAAELLSRTEDATEETYIFKHALVRDTAYQSLLRKTRRGLHERIAESLTLRFPDTARQNPELVAEHFSAAGRAADAVKFWLLAGQQALGRAANHEAIIHIKRGLELLSELPAEDRDSQELELLVPLIPALIATQGWAAGELEGVYRRAAELLKLLPGSPHRFTILTGTHAYHFVSGRVTQALPLANEVFELASMVGDPLMLTIAHQCCSATRWARGDFRLCVDHAQAALATLDVERERLIARMLSLSSCVGILFYEAVSLWMMGLPEQGLAASERSVSLALDIGHPPTTTFSFACRSLQALLQGDAEGAVKYCDESRGIAQAERLGFWGPTLTSYRGWAISDLGKPKEVSANMRIALETYRQTGNGILVVLHSTILAGVQWKAGEWENAFQTLDIAMKLARTWGEGLFEPELYRLRGEFLFAQALGAADPAKTTPETDLAARLAEAESSIRESLFLARHQGAKLLELRSLVSLCRVREKLGSVSRERDELAAAYD
ncbi:MAG: adenylate/guanylate cyclase domain-containing protein, partial [Terracidiphilus sp.]